MNQNQTESKPETVEEPRDEGLSSSVLFADLLSQMDSEAKEFRLCAMRHDALENYSTMAVANRAAEILTRLATEIRSANDKVSGQSGREGASDSQ